MTAQPPKYLILDKIDAPIGAFLIATDDEGVLRAVDFWDNERALRGLLVDKFLVLARYRVRPVDCPAVVCKAGLTAAHAMTAPADLVVICMSEPSPFGAVLTGRTPLLDDVEGRLTVFEVIEEACMPARIRDDLVDQLARDATHGFVVI